MASRARKVAKAKWDQALLIGAPMPVRFQFCTCCFQPLLLSCCQCFPVNRKNFKHFSLLFEVFCLSSILAFVFQRIWFASCSLPTLKMLCFELLLPSLIPDYLLDTSPNLYWFLPQGDQYSPCVSGQSVILSFFFGFFRYRFLFIDLYLSFSYMNYCM